MLAGEVITRFSADPAGFIKALEDIQKQLGATDAQMKQFTRSMSSEADKMMQAQIRASLGITDANQKMGKSFEGIIPTIKSFAGILGVTLGAGAAVSYVKGIVELGSHLKDLEGQTDISASTFSQLKTTLETSGSTVDQFARVMFNMSRQIGEIKTTSDPALKALKDLGINFEDIRRQSPEEQMRTVAAALANIDDAGRRAALGTALLGPAYRQVQSALEDVAKGLDQVNASLSEDQLNRLDQFSKAWKTFSNVLEFGVANALLTAGENLDKFGAKFRQWLRDTFPSGSMRNVMIDPLLKMSEERDKALLAFAPEGHPQSHEEAVAKPGGPFPGLIDKETDNKIKSLTESLNRQIDALRVHSLEITKDDEAAIKLKVSQEILLAVGAKNAGMFAKQAEEVVNLTIANKALEESQKHQALVLGEMEKAGALESKVTQQMKKDQEELNAMFGGEFIKSWVETVDQAMERLQIRLGNVITPETLSDSQKAFGELFDSITQGIDSTLKGVMEGSQSLGEGMKNLARNMIMSFNEELLKLAVFNPIKNLLMDWMKGSNIITPGTSGGAAPTLNLSGIGSSIGGFFSSIAGLLGFANGGIVPGMRGQPVPIMAHAGERVIPLGQREGSGNQGNVQVKIMGDVVPREPTMRKEDVIQIGLSQFEDRGVWQQSLEQRMSPRR